MNPPSGMTTFYLNRETGALTTEPGPWTWPLEGYTLRVTRPLVISCGVHNRYDPVGQVESAEVVGSAAPASHGFLAHGG